MTSPAVQRYRYLAACLRHLRATGATSKDTEESYANALSDCRAKMNAAEQWQLQVLADSHRIADFLVSGDLATKKNSPRIVRNRRTGKPFLLPSKAATTWQTKAAWWLKSQWQGLPPIDFGVHVRALFYRQRNVGDLCNYIAITADALEEAQVLQNDRLILSWDGSRLGLDREVPRVRIELLEYEETAI